MKRHKSTVPPILLIVLLLGASAQAQEQVPPAPYLQQEQERLRERLEEVLLTYQGRGQQGVGVRTPTGDVLRGGAGSINAQIGGAWWTNTALVERLGLTNDQKAKIERAFENHRQNIVSSTGLLEREEALLARLLEAEPIDRGAVLAQTDRVIQARGEMERANAAMTLEMRESLTRAQWLQLQSANIGGVRGGAPRGGGQRQQ